MRCLACGHTAEDHERLGWTCDCACPWKMGAGDVPAPAASDLGPDEHTCTTCGARRPHTIRRINIQGAPRICDPCFSERTRS